MLDRRHALLASFAVTLPLPLGAAGGQDFSFPNIDGGEIDLSLFAGRPVLVVNTASHCGFTPQYDALQALADDYMGRAVVLAVPSDDFGGQEFATEAEVKAFCTVNFALTLPMTEITEVRGATAHPFYRWAATQGVVPRWNFHKILLDGDGRLVRDFPSQISPESRRLRGAIDALL